ncbi:BTB/POZ/MATH-domain protein [Rhynchospora pubera]|uniref:BTB/POZ/MATH-domain protein n=1 Tax=Rhynchospora pubera TaxID=906938 RepID=A0AAV8HRE7_9POAL|nr:BTB/POZ/MATH-domain protein [Rhynchospora pubera]
MALLNDGDLDEDASYMSMEVACGTFQFKVDYLKTKSMAFNEYITSPIFKVNGHDCKILYFPSGYFFSNGGKSVGMALAMHCKSEDVTASFSFGLLDKYGRLSSNACVRINMWTFSKNCWDENGIPWYMERSELEADFLRDGCFTLVCSVMILSESYKEVPKRFVSGIMPSNIDDHFVDLFERKETTDVSFEVDGEIFTAHRSVLAARSPVFNAQLFGSMTESKMETIAIKDIKPLIFKAMLHFIYTDSLPDMSDENIPLVIITQHLLVAADRYGLDGLKSLCEDRLSRDISMDTAISTLALAEELNLVELKDHCLCFISDPKNLLLLSVTDEYVQLMQRYPCLLKKIGDEIRGQF